jgi:putative oxidoreductase
MKNIEAKKLDVSLLIVRILLGIVIGAHGAQKLFGWFGGFGFDGTMNYFTETIGLPYLVALVIIFVESLGMLALTLGLFSRVIAAILIAIMVGAIVSVHGEFGFFMNWSGSQGGEGFEFHLMTIALSSVLMINGSGVYSLDNIIARRSEEHTMKKTSFV